MPTRALLATALLAACGAAQAADVALARLDCGGPPEPVSVAAFSDTFEFDDTKLPLTYSCYLVRDGDRYLLWDTGNALDGSAAAPKVPLVQQLARIGLKPGDIDVVGISHYHDDHTGQLAMVPDATLLIGRADWNAVTQAETPAGMDPKAYAERRARFAPWIGRGKLQTVGGDRHDVFGDGRVLMLDLPGHTPGHRGLLVKLEKTGNVLLSGDVTHFHENYASNGVPTWNTNRADSLASLDRFKKAAANLKATVVIQHDPRDIGKLPAFPDFAK
ncbi:N-acyl homoserine lactonase family protein [Cognatilysobacter segetis]|uniref:N-acyl homoserine lactonase family protein n=1 Tax=Cognatilysobacter segetis TaxID=2492394 RepID=UPI00105E53FC|nr:N-acyl homoserine lactonase family protein [Lysobacter segetis]